ncbi:carbohydrate-binding protein [Deefgea sp. CFH1-16]|uniref:carbohydrate-binding protein n=1 Tax=Deefgea sp. CFH1-16 TaxID=2675457 RepID=UPI0015F3C11B|nr:carbohydrate-binding protein [Deefgea sp. CFH1-16]
MCNKPSGCGVASPGSANSGWVDVGQFSNSGTIDITSACTPPNTDGSPKVASATGAPTAIPSAPATPPPTPSASNKWEIGVTYATGQEIIFEGQRYKCIQGHVSQTGWSPTDAPALWKKL